MVGLSGLSGFGIFGVDEDRVLSVAENGGTGVRRAAPLSFLTSGPLVDKDKEWLFDISYTFDFTDCYVQGCQDPGELFHRQKLNQCWGVGKYLLRNTLRNPIGNPEKADQASHHSRMVTTSPPSLTRNPPRGVRAVWRHQPPPGTGAAPPPPPRASWHPPPWPCPGLSGHLLPSLMKMYLPAPISSGCLYKLCRIRIKLSCCRFSVTLSIKNTRE